MQIFIGEENKGLSSNHFKHNNEIKELSCDFGGVRERRRNFFANDFSSPEEANHVPLATTCLSGWRRREKVLSTVGKSFLIPLLSAFLHRKKKKLRTKVLLSK